MKIKDIYQLNINKQFWVGFAVCALGIFLAVWLGVWIFFIGGIIQIIESIKSDPVSVWGILFGIIRIKLALVAFWVSIFSIVGTGIGIIKTS